MGDGSAFRVRSDSSASLVHVRAMSVRVARIRGFGARPELYPVKKIVGFDHQMIDAIEKWRGKQRPIPNASEAIRKLVEIGLASAYRAVLRTKKATDASEMAGQEIDRFG